ncbi:MAG: hypothetical protein N3G48_03750 [Sulfolobales archaeon]|nr:hypothetical protein [Sulfolobales archaeon]
MALTRCVIGNEAFICDVSLVGGRIIIHNAYKDLLHEIKVSDVIGVYEEGNTLVIETSKVKVFISNSGTSPMIKDIGRALELKIRYQELSIIIKDVLLNMSNAYRILTNIIKTFQEDYVGRWVLLPQYVNELYSISRNLMRYDINIRHYIDVLNHAYEGRSVNAVKNSIRSLALNMTRLVDEYIKTLLTFEDLTPLLSLVVLAYCTELANLTNQPLEAKKAEDDLLKICTSEIHVKMLSRPEVDICRKFAEDLRDRGTYDAVNAFVDNYLKALEGSMRKLLGLNL